MTVVVAFWRLLDKIVRKVSEAFVYVAGFALFLTILIILREAFGRYFFDAPTSYGYPLVSTLMLVIVYFSLPYTAAIDGHVSSDLIYDHLPPRGKAVVQLVGDVAAGVLGYLLSTQIVGQIQRSMELDASIAQLWGLPVAALQMIVLAGSALLGLVAVIRLPVDIGRVATGHIGAIADTTPANAVELEEN